LAVSAARIPLGHGRSRATTNVLAGLRDRRLPAGRGLRRVHRGWARAARPL